ncbi:ATP-binding cassette sub-family A member 17-like [Ornithodoros turicata]|uniref:ATP-binding cassette sub-family A member 17-like n=1 Tax=Ornithodoros turicata TaxID=34597 RepID=UPI003138DB66
MGCLKQIRIMLWKNIWIQTILRHPCLTAVEIVFAFLFTIALLNAAYLPDTGGASYVPAKVHPPVVPPVLAKLRLVYGPSSPYAAFMVSNAFPDLEDPTQIPPDPKKSRPFVELGEMSEVQENCQTNDYCVFLHSDGSNTNDLNYSVVVHVNMTDDLGVFRQSYYEPVSPALPMIVSLQAQIERAHLKWVERNVAPSALSDQVLTRHVPMPTLVDAPRLFYRFSTFILLALVFVVPFCMQVSIIVTETGSGIKEMLKLMGLHECIYWIAHLCTQLLITTFCSLLISLILVYVRFGSENQQYLSDADFRLVMFTMLMFCFHVGMHTLLVSCMFQRSNVGVTFSILYWVVLSFYPVIEIGSDLSSFYFASVGKKLLLCITPVAATHWTLWNIGLYSDLTGTPTWSIVTRHVTPHDNITISEMWTVMVLSWFAIAILVWYLTRVLPWVTGIPQPFYFPVLPSYWVEKTVTVSKAPAHRAPELEAGFEAEPTAEAVISIVGLRKNFGSNVALDGIDIKFYAGEITVLLGHNGAGKTTMINILTGILSPTEGTAIICGYDILKNTTKARKNITLCPQFDVFFPDLTVEEHLTFFGTMRGLTRTSLAERMASVLQTVRLSAKIGDLSDSLSGGMKRRLSIAIAIVSNPKVLILDEPTSGIDPETRRELWDLFFSLRKQCSIVLSTHDMEEADVLGDRIAIMAEGSVHCWGTPNFLKKAFGTGYQVHLQKAANFNINGTLTILRQTAPNAEVADDGLTEVRISLQVTDPTGFETMFQTLESQRAALGIASVGVTVSTMEDVYIKITAWWNPFYDLSVSLSLSLANTALLGQMTGDVRARMVLTVVQDSKNYSYGNNSVAQKQEQLLDSFVGGAINQMLRAVFIPLALAFTVAVTSLYVVMERMNNSMAVQLMTGTQPALLYSSNLIFDSVGFALTWILIGVLYTTYYEVLLSTVGAAVVAFFVIAAMTSSLSYCISHFVDSQGKAFTVELLLFSVGGTIILAFAAFIWVVGLISFALSHSSSWVTVVIEAMMIMPPCCAPYTLIRLLRIDSQNQICHKYSDIVFEDYAEAGLSDMCILYEAFGLDYCCEQYMKGKRGNEIILNPLALSKHGIGYQLCVMVVEAVIFFLVICYLDSSTSTWNAESDGLPSADSDVEQERNLVRSICATNTWSQYTLVVRGLKKVFNNLIAVNGISFTVRPKECFGLLGVNGAGKTTTFQMLTGLLPPTAGEGYMGNTIMRGNISLWQSKIGYCMQSGGIIGQLTAYESLYLMARLRGVREKEIKPLVNSMVKLVDLTMYASRVSDDYSGGNKRKLCVAVAMIALPELTFLDEPSAGVDVVARRKIFNSIKVIRVTSGVSIVLTSHSMDECEAACDRIAIMVSGRLHCLGPLQHLKQKLGKGYTLTIKMAVKDDILRAHFEAAISEVFPGISLTDYHQGLYEFQLQEMLPWSEMFRRIAILRAQFQLESCLASDTTLEKIFISLARRQLYGQQVNPVAPAPQQAYVAAPMGYMPPETFKI